jgi:hypothetical protein
VAAPPLRLPLRRAGLRGPAARTWARLLGRRAACRRGGSPIRRRAARPSCATRCAAKPRARAAWSARRSRS